MTTVYCRPADNHLHFHSTSGYKSSSIIGVALRLRGICFTTEEYQNKGKQYLPYSVARGYNPKTVKSTLDKIEKVSRSVAKKKKNRSVTTTSVIFPVEFNSRGPYASEIINKHRHLLEKDDILKQLFPEKPIINLNKIGRTMQ